MDLQKKKVPLVVSDLDGVFLQKRVGLPGGRECIKLLQENQHIPFLFMTNRTGVPEKTLADILNNAFDLNKENNDDIHESQVIMSHSPMIELFKQYKDQTILVMSRDLPNFEEFMNHLGVKKYITTNEYANLYPDLLPLKIRENQQKQTAEIIEKRLNITNDQLLKEPLQVAAVFLMTSGHAWEESFQVILDVLSTEDGRIGDKIIKGKGRKHIPVYTAFDDLTYKDVSAIPRFIIGGFNQALKDLYSRLYEDELEIQICGKPSKLVFDYAENYVLNDKQFKELNLEKDYHNFEITNKYMIGDNPESDIKGANSADKWISILVRTGVFQGGENDKENPATYVVENITEAIKLICKLENISHNL